MQEDWASRFERARQKHLAQKALQQKQQGEHGLVRIGGTRSELSLPPDVFERLGGVATYAEAVWTCGGCEESPEPRQYANGFIPGKCSCQLAQLQQARRDRERMEVLRYQQERERAQCAKCYTWLGLEWSSFGLERKTFETFEMDLQSDGFTAAAEFASQRYGNLVLWSDASWGTGKTHLAAAICNYLLAAGIPCRFTTAQNMFNAFAARMDEDQGYSDLLAEAGKTPLLVIDDLDKVHLTKSGYKQGIFFEVFNHRYLRHLPTVITTNARVEVTYDDVTGLSDYIGRAAASRLCDKQNGGLTVVEMNGDDYRRRER